jgi:choline dehydrogenase
MPYVTNGNIYAPVMMAAEKAADLILGNTPLPPEPVEFFRRDRDSVRTSENQARSDD